eukprot:TRINITY_DN6718_c0_g1_i2.p5 TRINITY_DN6718_c0_g1~~TRINITY_DN6718_c0_g1_i2.p5  ORF type:complete len:108 (+),score=42.00 TRINITY_DN6718_c0_g1_i2:186-509(+)
MQVASADEADDAVHHDPSDGSQVIFPSFDGFGLYEFQAAMNHSCVPNCQTFYEGDDDFRCTVRIIRDVLPNEELTISCIENGYAQRKAELLESGFECDCPRCHAERR